MKDYIKELCMSKKIKLVYTENKLTVLSNGVQNGIPVLRIHKIFKNCPKKTAQTVVNYYLEAENREDYIKKILTYVKKRLGVGDYRIAPLSGNFMNTLILVDNFEEGAINLKPELTELSIYSLMQKDFNSSNSKRITDGVIEVEDDNLIELDIVVVEE